MPDLDPSVLVAALTNEAATSRIQAWRAAQPPGDLAISAWGVMEFSAALSSKVRTGAVDRAQSSIALAAFAQVSAASFRMLLIRDETFDPRHDLPIRRGFPFGRAMPCTARSSWTKASFSRPWTSALHKPLSPLACGPT